MKPLPKLNLSPGSQSPVKDTLPDETQFSSLIKSLRVREKTTSTPGCYLKQCAKDTFPIRPQHRKTR